MGQRSFPRKDHATPHALDLLVADIMAYLAHRPDDMMRFFELSGLAPQSLRDAVGMPEFALNLLDFVCSDERLLRAFSAECGRDPSQIDAMRLGLARPFEGEGG